MRILIIRSGLGNQMLNYAFGRYMEEMSGGGVEIYHDFSFFYNNNPHNGFELDRIFPNIKLNPICNAFDKNSEYYGNTNIGFETHREICLKELRIDKLLIASSGNFDFLKNSKYTLINQDLMIRNNGKFNGDYYENIYFHGFFFHNTGFFKAIKDKMRYEFQFYSVPDEQNKKYLEYIKSCVSVGVHIRRGDFIERGWELRAEDYAPDINKLKNELKEQGKKPIFFIFTNDFIWFKENIKEHGFDLEDEVVLVEGNDVDAKNYIDMQLMSHCDYMINNVSSSFSRMGALLNPNLTEHIEIRRK